MDEPMVEDITARDQSLGIWTIGYTGADTGAAEGCTCANHACVQSDVTLRAKSGVDKETGYDLSGDYFGLPWPCLGHAGD